MRVAVTAASGKLGSSIAGALCSQIGAQNVVSLARSPSKISIAGVEKRKGDYDCKEDFIGALQGVDAVLLVSGMDHPDKRIGQHRNVINGAKQAGVKKIVYSSIIGEAGSSHFDPIVLSNRQTEKDIAASGLAWSIGRNGLYIEPDIEYLDKYIAAGKIANCAGSGKCSYTTRAELAYAYTQMIQNDDRNGKTFTLSGESITQQELVDFLNAKFNLSLTYQAMSPEEYLEMQKQTNGEFLGPVIAGIYTKIRNGEFAVSSEYEDAAGREHQSWEDYFSALETTFGK